MSDAKEAGTQVATWFHDAEPVSIVTVIIIGAAVLLLLKIALNIWEPRQRPPKRGKRDD